MDQRWSLETCGNILGLANFQDKSEAKRAILERCRQIIARSIESPDDFYKDAVELIQHAEHSFTFGFMEDGFAQVKQAMALFAKREKDQKRRRPPTQGYLLDEDL